MKLLLFDVDGVLVNARGYLRALQDTVAHFGRALGLGEHLLSEADVRTLEACGLTSEWDSAPVCVGALLIERLRVEPRFTLPATWPETLAALAARPRAIGPPDYAGLAAHITRLHRAEPWRLVSDVARDVLDMRADDLEPPQRWSLAPMADALLCASHDFDRAPVMRHFQHRVIGSAGVAATYGIAPDFDAPAYLRDDDTPQFLPTARARLLDAVASGDVRGVIYTARPSLPPADIQADPHGYSPEAELARELVGLDGLPLIGYGRVRWLAARVGVDADTLVKPSPVQALAAIGAAWSGQEAAALEAAWALHRHGALRAPLAELPAASVHVFEDSVGGIQAVREAVKVLRDYGCALALCEHGITPLSGAKAAAMAEAGVATWRTVNAALDDAMSGQE